MNAWIQTGIGVALGFIASYTYLRYLGTRVVPRIDFSKNLYCGVEQGKRRYWMEVRNSNKRRGILEPRFLATFRVSFEGRNALSVWDIPVSNLKILRLAPGGKRRLFLNPAGVSDFVRDQVRMYSMDEIDTDAWSIADLFSIGTDATLTVEMIGYDERSATRKYLKSHIYRAEDILLSSV